MEPGLRTPIIDLFRRGEVDRDVTLLAARGALFPRSVEQLGLLMLLVHDSDAEIAAIAEATLHTVPIDWLRGVLARTDVPEEMRSFFAARGVEPSDHPVEDAELRAEETSRSEATDGVDVIAPQDGAEEDRLSVLQRVASMTVAERVSAAMKGSREERAILIRDPNKIVSLAVLSSAKITQSEVEAIAKMTSVSDDTLRTIAGTRAWMKNYSIALALARNAKTPVGLSMNLLSRLNDRDLKALSADRNIPEALRIAARQKVSVQK